MNLNRFYNKYLLLFLILSALFGNILKPSSGDKYSEFLDKKNKNREYHKITREGLEYTVVGPAEIKIFSKAAFPKKTIQELKKINFNILVNDFPTESSNLKNIDKSTTSLSHPMHVYTYSGKDIIVLPGGTHTIRIYKNSIFDPPILIRVSRSARKSKKIEREEFDVVDNFPNYTLSSINSTFNPSYYFLNDSRPLFFHGIDDIRGGYENNVHEDVILYKEDLSTDDIDEIFEFKLRGVHDSSIGDDKIIEAILLKNGKQDAKYHILSIPHPSKIINENDRIPGKLNKIYINADQDNCLFYIDDSDSELLVRIDRLLK